MLLLPRTILRTHSVLSSTILYRRLYGGQDDCMTSMHPDVNIPRTGFIEHSWRNFNEFPNHVATECAQTGRKYTFDELRTKSEALGRSLRTNLNLQRRDTVALLLPNVPEYPICIYGIMLGGLRMTAINPTYTAEEVERLLRDCGAKAIITLNEHYTTVTRALDLLKTKLHVLIIKTVIGEAIPEKTIDFHNFIDCKDNISDTEPLDNDELFFIPYTSGTTGLPKGAMITATNLLSVMCQLDSDSMRFWIKTSESHQDVIPQVLPMFHIYGYAICTLSLLQSGVKLVTVPKFTPELYLECLQKHRPTILGLVPPLVIFLYSHPAVQAKYFNNLRVITCGAAPLGKVDEGKFREKVEKPIKILQGYGLTETAGLVLTVPMSAVSEWPGNMGHPIPNCSVKVVNPEDPELKHLGPNTAGELLVKGPQVMRGYYNRPEDSRSAFVDGWYRTGDLVRYDDDRMFYIVDRIKELIKVKGLQVAPVELEEVIRSYPDVAEAGVIGIPHEYSGEVPRAYVVPKPGTQIDVKKLEEYVESKVAPHKRLSGGVAVIDSLPRSASGKILRRQLQLAYQNEPT